jgi:leucyl-tRNA synthetase
MNSYNHREIERKWRDHWLQEQSFTVDLAAARRPYYNLMMFPYPSAEGLHMGNLFSYTGSDVHGRFRRAQGYDVFEPFGWDAFGIHSENYALKTGRHPRDLTPANIDNFRRQLLRLGIAVDWSHEIDSTDPSYYRWTQWLFLRLFDAGLIYQRQAAVNWCPSCRTVLSAEQSAGGICERCDATVEQREMLQWFARISKYADRLLAHLDDLDWSPITRQAQGHWIGRSEGARILFAVDGGDTSIDVFTTRPDTLWGATYLVLAPEHPLIERLTTSAARSAVEHYTRAARSMSLSQRQQDGDKKTGVFTGAHAVHPATGERIPIWTANYVLMDYGSGAIMAVPAHDPRDLAFATAFGLPVRTVIESEEVAELPYEGEGRLVDSGPFNGASSTAARQVISAWLEETNAGGPHVQYRLRDWCLSRQRYWGPPIPIVHCDDCGPVRVPDEELPVLLPDLEDYAPDGSGRSPLARCDDFVHTACPACGKPARRDTDVSDNFLDSAWYFLRYPCHDRQDVPFDTDVLSKWLPIHMYVGGNEHAVLHLMYTRFLTMALHDLDLLPFEEPFQRFRANGIITRDGAKMSKSKGNVVSPDDLMDRFGADALRTYLMFSGNFQEGGDFQEGGIHGVQRFLERLWRYVTQGNFAGGAIKDTNIERALYRTIDKVTRDMEDLHYNTAVAALMELLNTLTAGSKHFAQARDVLLQMLSPLAPFIAQELWQRTGGAGEVCNKRWPVADPEKIVDDDVTLVVQVDGKVRAKLQLPLGMSRDDAETAALNEPLIASRMQGQRVLRIIYVPDRLINMVLTAE